MYEDNKPRVGQLVTYKTNPVGCVHRVEDDICWVHYTASDAIDCFIWRFKDGLNKLHDWPTKTGELESAHVRDCSDARM